ncbi:MAG: SRPBCC domain-containing protein [Candidatus Thermoplasmatota archaeon]|nr:SRPBCC domain-containing protein [Candidatus Thermoplasmatota archaeon]
MSRELRTEIMIDAEPDRVWNILTDQDALEEWNPFIREMSGELKEGERIRVYLTPPKGRAMTFRPRVKEVSPGKELRWLGHLGVPGLFDGEHIFEIHPAGPKSTRFVQREKFGGLFVPRFWKTLDTDTREGFEAMNMALKQRAEAVA